jgi:hypothetical protein
MDGPSRSDRTQGTIPTVAADAGWCWRRWPMLGAPVTPTEVEPPAIGLPKADDPSPVRNALEAEGYRDARDRRAVLYAPGGRLRRMAANTCDLVAAGAHGAAGGVQSRLADEIGETCNIATPDREGDDLSRPRGDQVASAHPAAGGHAGAVLTAPPAASCICRRSTPRSSIATSMPRG